MLSDQDIVTTWRSSVAPADSGAADLHGLDELYEEGEALLARCVGDTAAFFAGHWEQQPLLSGGHPSLNNGVLSLADLERVLQESKLRLSDIAVARRGRLCSEEILRPAPMGSDLGSVLDPVVDLSRVLAEIASGATLALYGLHRWWQPVRELCDSLSVRLSHHTGASAFLTPAGAPGVPRHFDLNEVLVVQTHGTKRWIVEAPTIDLPLWSHRASVAHLGTEPGNDVVLETTLTPGQCLYIPRGFIHSAASTTDPSLHVTFGIEPLPLEAALHHQVHLAAEQFRTLRITHAAAFATTAEVDLEHRFARTIQGIRFDTASVLASSRDQFWTNHQGPSGGRLIELLDREDIDLDTPIRRTPRIVLRTHTIADRHHLRIDDRDLSMPAQVAPWVTELLDGQPTTVARIASPPDHHDVLALARRFVREGILTRVPPESVP